MKELGFLFVGWGLGLMSTNQNDNLIYGSFIALFGCFWIWIGSRETDEVRK